MVRRFFGLSGGDAVPSLWCGRADREAISEGVRFFFAVVGKFSDAAGDGADISFGGSPNGVPRPDAGHGGWER